MGCAPSLKYIDYGELSAGLTKEYVAEAQGEYHGIEYVQDGMLTDEGVKALSEILVRANVEHDILKVAMNEIEVLREMVDELSRAQIKMYLKGMGMGALMIGVFLLILFLVEEEMGVEQVYA